MAIQFRRDGTVVCDAEADAIAWLNARLSHERKGEGSPYDTGPAPTITAREGGGYAVEHDGAELGSADAVWPEALRVVEATGWFQDAVARKKPDELSGGKLAEGRWFDAARHEDAPAVQGGQLTKEKIDEIVRNLAGLKRAAIVDGGDLASTPHGSVEDPTNTPASGYVLAGVRVVESDGSWHLWLYCRLHNEVHTKVDEREYVYGSVAWIDDAVHPYTGDEIGSRLLSYALTSEPLQEGLTPHPVSEGGGDERSASIGPAGAEVAKLARALPQLLALAGERPLHSTAYARSNTRAPAARRKADMKKRTELRGPAKEALGKLASMLGVDVSEMTQEKIWELMDMVGAVASAAKSEATIEALGGGGGDEGGEKTSQDNAETKTGEETPQPAPRAVEGLEGDALDAWVTAVIAWARDVFGAPEANPAALLELMTVATDAVKSAVSGEQKPADNAGEGGQEQGGELRTAKAELFGLKRSAIARDAEVAKLTAENAELRGVKDAHEVDALIDAKFRAAEIDPPAGDARAELRAIVIAEPDATKREALVDTTLKAANRPPMGLRTTPTAETPKGGAPLTEGDAYEHAKGEVLRSNPELAKDKARLYEATRKLMQTGVAG